MFKKRVLYIERDEFNSMYYVLKYSDKRVLCSKSYVVLALYAAYLCYGSKIYIPAPDLLDFVDSITDFANYKYIDDLPF